MADFKQGDVVCLDSDLEHKFTVHQIISAACLTTLQNDKF